MPNSVDIDALAIQIEADAAGAVSGLKTLSGVIAQLDKITQRARNIDLFGTQIAKLGVALKGANLNNAVSQLNRISDAAANLDKLKGIKLNSLFNQLSRLPDVTAKLQSTNIAGFETSIEGLTRGLSKLGSVGKISLKGTFDALDRLPSVALKLEQVNFSWFNENTRQLAKGLSALSNIKGTGFSQIIRSMEKLQALGSSEFDALGDSVLQLTDAFRPLGDVMRDIADGFSILYQVIPNVASALNVLSGNSNKANKSVDDLLKKVSQIHFIQKARLVVNAVKNIGSSVMRSINTSTDYMENLNLFTVAMGDFAGEAREYAETVGDIMGIDPSEWMRGQGVFQTLLTGFGLVNERAALMSRNLTQLAYDISSYFNISVDDAFLKLQSGISGEIEPLRRLGYDLSQAKLQAIAFSLGIDQSVQSMTQAEKSQLRYYAILTQVTKAQGDLSRTLHQPANQLRILSAQWQQLTRSIGNVFIPILNQVLPYIIATVRVLRWAIQEIANMLGFVMPEVDYSGISMVADAGEEAASVLDDATNSAKAFRRSLLGIDELNILGSPDTSGSGSGGAGVGGSGFEIELPTYDFLGDLVDNRATRIFDNIKRKVEPFVKWLVENFDTILQFALLTGVALLGWKLSVGITNLLTGLGVSGLGLKIPLGITLAITGAVLIFDSIKNLSSAQGSLSDLIKALLGAAGLVGGLTLAFKTTGAVIGLVASMVIALVAISIAQADALQERIETAVFDAMDGGISLDSVILHFENIGLAVESTLSPLTDLRKKVDDARQATVDAYTAADNLFNRISTGVLSAQGGIPLLTQAVQDMTAAWINEINALSEHLLTFSTGLGKPFLMETMGEEGYGQWLTDIIAQRDSLVNAAKDIETAITDLNQEFADGKITQAEWITEYISLMDQFGKTNPIISEMTASFSVMISDFNNIDLESPEEVQAFFDEIITIISDTKQKIEDEKKGVLESLYGLFPDGIPPEVEQAVHNTFAAMEAALDNEVLALTDGVQSRLLFGMQSAFESLGDSASAGTAYDALEAYITGSFFGFGTSAVEKISNMISELYTDAGIKAKPWVLRAGQDVLDSFISEIGSATDGEFHDYTGENLSDLIIRMTSLATQHAIPSVTKSGESVIDGLFAGMSGAMGAQNWTGLFDRVNVAFENTMEIKSPSRVWKRYGLNLANALYDSLEDEFNSRRFRNLFDDINDAFENTMEIKSPSRVWKRYGLNLGSAFTSTFGASMGQAISAWERLPYRFEKAVVVPVNRMFKLLNTDQHQPRYAVNAQSIAGIRQQSVIRDSMSVDRALERSFSKLSNQQGGNWTINIVDTDGNIKASTIISALERQNKRDGVTTVAIGA